MYHLKKLAIWHQSVEYAYDFSIQQVRQFVPSSIYNTQDMEIMA